jgi:hypothetical protein
MSRYVTKNHGLIIGSGNIFFYMNDDGEMKHFNAIVSARDYRFAQINSLNVSIRTPAQQILFQEVPANDDDKIRHREEWLRTVIIPTDFITRWLNENTPGWGFPQRCRKCDASFFFAKRSHAVAFCKKVDDILKGIDFSR